MRKNFSCHTLAEIFRDLYLQEASGILHLKHGETEKRIYFCRGLILYAESPLPEENLGQRLVHEGKISRGALSEASRNISDEKDLAQVLVNRGLLSKTALSDTVHFLAGKIVRSIFAWEGGTAWFHEGWLLQELYEGDMVSTFEWILEGVGSMADFDTVKETLTDLKSRIELKTPFVIPLEKMKLTPQQGFILGQIDGTTCLKDILSILPPDQEDDAAKFMFTLLVMGVARLSPKQGDGPFAISSLMRSHLDNKAMETAQREMIEKTYQRYRDASPYEILNIDPAAGKEAIVRSYERAKRTISKAVLLPRLRDHYRSELAVIESRLVEAYLTLTKSSNSPARTENLDDVHDERRAEDFLVRLDMDKTSSQRQQDQAVRRSGSHYTKALKCLREGDYHNAIQYGKLAISHNPADARFFNLLADCQMRNPEARWQRMAEKNFLRANELDPWNTDYLIRLGRFYKRRGLRLRARKKFEEALKISPSHETAEQELKNLS